MTPPVQLTMLAPPAGVRHDDGDTARAAAASQTPGKLSAGRTLALLALHDHPAGLTDFDLAAITGKQQTSIGCRRKNLVDLGFAEDSGARGVSPTGSAAVIWRLTDEGHNEAARTLLADTG